MNSMPKMCWEKNYHNVEVHGQKLEACNIIKKLAFHQVFDPKSKLFYSNEKKKYKQIFRHRSNKSELGIVDCLILFGHLYICRTL